MKLYTVTDWDGDWDGDWCFSWFEAVWADSKESAIEWAVENYGGRANDDQVRNHVRVSNESDVENYRPTGPLPNREGRLVVLRQVGWKMEGEWSCEKCELHAMGMKEHYVCRDCCRCPSCSPNDCESCSE